MTSNKFDSVMVYPQVQMVASGLSKASQKNHYVLVGTSLIILVVAAILSKYKIPALDFKYNQTLLLVVGLLISIYLYFRKPERSWYSSRSLSETVKTLSWRFSLNAVPFTGEDQDSKVFEERVLEACAESNSVSTFKCLSSILKSPTLRMLEIKSMSLDERIEVYGSNRVLNQLRWYRKQAKSNKLFSVVFFVFLCLTNVSAVVMSYFSEVDSTLVLPTEVFITLASSLIGWKQAKNYVELAAAYELTAYEIDSFKDELRCLKSESDFSEFVVEMESLFSREHTQWVAKRS